MVRVITHMGPAVIDAIAARYPDIEVVEFTRGDPPAGLRADVFYGGWAGWDDIARWIDAAGVSWLQLAGTGADGVPSSIFERCIVTCARGASAGPISEWVMAAVLAWAKRMPQTFLSAPPRHWNFPSPALDVLEGATIALVGLGGIGTAIAQRAIAFGMHVRALRRTDVPSPVAGVEIVTSLEALLPGAQHVVLAAPATHRTRHLLNADAFALMTPGVHFVNIARGALVDQDALRAALDDGTIVMATLDTVDPEPLPEGHWLYTHPSVRLTAHISWYTPDLQRVAVELFLDNLGRYVRGEPLLHSVDPSEGY
jgi:phosphoglycerate dehydrogenase-like enzyme